LSPLSPPELSRPLIDFLSGALTLGYLVIGIFFLRSWKRTGDRLFSWFAVAFFLLSSQRVALFFSEQPDENRTALLYGIRLIAFLLFLGAIIDKNRGGRSTAKTD
jgi:hypothetical protein